MKKIFFLIFPVLVLLGSTPKNDTDAFLQSFDFVVAQDGSGDFLTVQEAINAVPMFRRERTTIFIRKGIYKERLILSRGKNNVSFIGECVYNTILTYDNFHQRQTMFGENTGTSGSSSFFIFGNDFFAKNITFQNSAGPVGQAVAVLVYGDRAMFQNCRFLGYQDTLYPFGRNSRQFYIDCYIEGSVDFIFGSSTAVFYRSRIHSNRNGYITAPSTPQGNAFGFVFIDCVLTADEGVTRVYLGRPWRNYGQSVFINTEMGAHIAPEGWHNWRRPEAESTAFFAEYNNTGIGANTQNRVTWSHQLTSEQSAKYTIKKILAGNDGWNPFELIQHD